MNSKCVDILVIGAGPAGLAAAIAAREDGIDSLLVLEREHNPGGILRQCIHNGFGLHRFKEELTGPEYAQRDIDRARELGIDIQTDTTVLSVDGKTHAVTCVSRAHGVEVITAKAIILAMGCRERPRGALGTPGTRCAGIYSAGTAQKFVNLEGYMPGKRVVILGSGDIGLIMARRMTLQGAKVLACVELMPFSSGLNRNIVQCLNDYDIPLYLSHTVIDIKGRERLTGVTVARVDENRRPIPGSEIEFDCDTLLLSVGLIPENELSEGAGVKLSPLTSGAEVDDVLQTSVPGIFACGNVLHVHDLVDHVSNESFRAGHAAAAYVRDQLAGGETIPVRDGDGVRGAVPQRIRKGAAQEVDLMFRPSGVFRGATCVVTCGEREIARKKAPIFTPGEMAVVKLRPEIVASLDAPVTVTIERS
ncbi:MAG: FAD-dependent oxidoreductase [Clostridiales bacterium]|nr:FAD-dependent oxidoreductase [Clostridiales bacterium]MDY5514281.1 FAD-dependent oxidoreductase [Candidatus Ventricola sp.]